MLRAASAMLEETTEVPILIGRPKVVANRLERAGLSIKPGTDFELVNPQDDPRYRDYWQSYHQIMQRRGVTPELARAILRTNTTAHWRDHGASGRCRQPDLRHLRAISVALELCHAKFWAGQSGTRWARCR